MIEARMQQASVLKKVIDAVKEIVKDVNLEFTEEGISMQAMDNSHVVLCALQLNADGFDPYRCDRNTSIGVSLETLSKIFKSCDNNDVVTIKAEDSSDVMTVTFESKNLDRISEYEVKLMSIDAENYGIGDLDYDCTLRLPASDYTRIVRDLGIVGDTVTIETSKEGCKFKVEGQQSNVNIFIKPTSGIDIPVDKQTELDLTEPTNLSFALNFLQLFAKACPLVDNENKVVLNLSNSAPLMIDFKIGQIGSLKCFLAPKLDEE
ncbi:proliferating cell nuclear antigen [Ramicandelaber brevisporus]|nr:proliferating cell nuclear antigen [Ramicandelaber brevisporus]